MKCAVVIKCAKCGKLVALDIYDHLTEEQWLLKNLLRDKLVLCDECFLSLKEAK